MYQKVECITLTCDNCRETYQDEDTGFSIFVDKEAAHDAADNDGWYLIDKHYCPDCHTINGKDELVIDMTRTNPKDWEINPNEPVKESIVDDVKLKDFIVIDDHDGDVEIWTKDMYDIYIKSCIEHGACPSVRIVTTFNKENDFLEQKTQQLSNQEDKRAIEFADWIDKNVYTKGLNGKWYKIPPVLKGEQSEFTTKELYKQYLQSIK